MAHSASLSWTASPDVTAALAATPPLVAGYNVYRGIGQATGGEAATPINVVLIPGTTYVDSAVTEGEYDYYVTAVVAGAESLHSNEVTAVILPLAPTGLKVTGTT